MPKRRASGDIDLDKEDGAKYVGNEDAGEPYAFDPTFNGIEEGRKCTDCCMAIFFILFFCGMLALFFVALTRSNYKFLYIPTDTRGLMCGYDNSKLSINLDKYVFNADNASKVNETLWAPIPDLTKQKYLFWVRPGKPGYSRSFCVESCPKEGLFIDTFNQMIPKDITDPNYGKYGYPLDHKCGASANSTTATLANYSADPKTETNIYFCPYQTEPFALRCFPTTDALIGKEMQEKMDSLGDNITSALDSVSSVARAVQDLYLTWKWIAIAVVIALVLSLIYLLLLRVLAACMVYFTIILAIVGLGALTYMCYNQKDNKYGNAAKMEAYSLGLYSQKLNSKVFTVFFWIMVALDVIFLLLFIFLCKRIRLSVGIIKCVAKIFGHVPQLFFFPIFIYVLEFIWWCYVVGVAIVLFGAGKPYRIYDSANLVDKVEYKYDTLIQGFSVYHFVGFLWVTWFLSALGEMTIAGVCADYYFAADPRKKNMHRHTVLSSFGRCWRYHVGSLATGSLIITIMTLLRIAIEYVDKKTKQSQTECVKCVIKCMKCCLWCLEKFLKFLNRNCYIMIAIHGYNFWEGCKKAFNLLLRNCVRVATLNFVGDFSLFLGRVFVCGGVTSLSMYFFKYQVDGVTFVILPTLIVFVVSFLASGAFTNVFEMGIDATLLCFLEDEERNDGSPGHEKRVPEELAAFMSAP